MDISYSGINLFNTCQRKFYYYYSTEEEGEKSYNHYREVGSLVHLGLSEYLKRKKRKDYLEILHSQDCIAGDRDKAINILDAYRHFSIFKNDFSYIEEKFNYPITDNTNLRGVIDAITNINGQFFLVDWKVRSRFYNVEAVQNDLQLYIYSYIAENLFGIKLSGALQVQFNYNTPSIPSLTMKGEIDKRLGRTTRTVLENTFNFLNKDYNLQDYSDKIVEETEFIQEIPVNIGKYKEYFEEFRELVLRIEKETYFIPVRNSFICKDCQFLQECLK